MKKIILIIFLLNLVLFAQDQFQSIIVSDTFRVNIKNNYKLKSVNIIPFTERVFINKTELSKNDYKLNYVKKKLSLSDTLTFKINDTLIIEYHTLLTNLKSEYRLRAPKSIFLVPQESQKNILAAESDFSKESVFGNNINASGAIIRGFTIGTNKDFTLNSGLRLQLSGKLSDEVSIVAALTDENSPIQPEGNTERLDELDKVYIEIQHPNAGFTFGDYDFNSSVGIFGKINRKLQGIKAQGRYNNSSAELGLASSKGKFNSLTFSGTDGNQGPYRLLGVNSEKDIIIIAGSEKVYLDGILMKRGDNNDYIIEYSNAQITFTPKKLITSASRIIIDFEYSDKQYQRNFFGSSAEQKLFNDGLRINVGYFREADDFNNPIDFDLSEENKKILSSAGDDRNKAAVSGVVLAEKDSTGYIKGIYERIDSTIGGNAFSFYRYKPGDEKSIYNIVFSYVGSGNGDYIKKSSLHYKFVGKKNGDYLPIKFLTLPESMQLINASVTAKPFRNFLVNVELVGSDFDKNRLSLHNDSDNKGFARNVILNYSNNDFNISKIKLGKLQLSLHERFIDKYFNSIDRFNSAEFKRDYNIPDNMNTNESLIEFSFELSPDAEKRLKLSYGSLSKGNLVQSDRYLADIDLTFSSLNTTYKMDYVKSKQTLLLSDWTKQNGTISYKYFYFKPGFEFYDEFREEVNSNQQLLISSSFRFSELGGFLDIANFAGFTSLVKYSFRNEYFPLNQKLTKESDAITKQIVIGYSGIKEFNTSFDFIHRKKQITTEFKSISPPNSLSILIRSNTRVLLFNNGFDANIFYSAATQKTARYEKIFVRVEKGQGNYIYLGDVNNNGINDENEFEPTNFDGEYILTNLPTDELFPVIDLKTNFRFQLAFDKLLSNKTLRKYLSPLSTETVFRVEENSNSSDINNIYFLKLKYFLNEATTIRGNQFFQNDIYLFKNKNDFSMRHRFTQRRSLNQFSGGSESGFYRENNFRIKSKLIEEIGNQTDIIYSNDNLFATSLSNRERQFNSSEVITDFTYLPFKLVEIGFKFSISTGKDVKPAKPTEIDKNSQGLRINFSFENKGRLRFEAERIELKIKNSFNVIPFEITRGNVNGKNYFWSINFDYKVGMYLQTTFSYSGRFQPKSNVINLLRAEARAFF